MDACSSFKETASNYNAEVFTDVLQIFNI